MHFLPFFDLVLMGMGALFPGWGSESGEITTSDDVILFDAPAFVDPANPNATLAEFNAFVFSRHVHVRPATLVIQNLLSSYDIDVGHSLSNLVNRAKLFGAVGLGNKSIKLDIQGCMAQAFLSKTADFPESGLFYQNTSLGVCDFEPNNAYNATVVLSASDSRVISSSVFSYPDSGFGIISDVDDTVKITNVLNIPAMLKSTFLDDPDPVAGMPALYASLARTLSPHFFYISGSMLQIYPFLHNFIDTTYSASKGPLFLRNLTDIHDIVNFLSSDAIFEYKSAVIDQIRGMYPNKKFLVIGDSTQRDPETYGEAYRKYGDFVMCAWIRRVEGANNTAARFAAAFEGMPVGRWRVFNDSDIPDLAGIDVANGEC